jgi:hypothetical protein
MTKPTPDGRADCNRYPGSGAANFNNPAIKLGQGDYERSYLHTNQSYYGPRTLAVLFALALAIVPVGFFCWLLATILLEVLHG